MRSHRLGYLALALLPLLTGTSCEGTERLVRVTPFADGATRDRVNIWPLLYHDHDATAVLWPFFDVDDSGFALRPIVSKDGPKWSFLFPLAQQVVQRGQALGADLLREQGVMLRGLE